MSTAPEPSASDLRAALARFDRLIRADARESEFQRLFAERPYILSSTLPLKVLPNEVRALGRPGRSEPDFVLFPSQPDGVKTYGIVELKRPSSTVLVERRKGLVTLSSDAVTAVAQGQQYRRDLLNAPPVRAERLVLIGTPAMVFIIMGLSDRLGAKLAFELARSQLDGLLPGGCHLLPYDVLRDAFSASVPPRIIPLALASREPDLALLVDLVERHRFDWSMSYLSDEAIEFWGTVEGAIPAEFRGTNRIIERAEWEVASGKYQGTIATESPNDLLFATRVLDVIETVHRAAQARGISNDLAEHGAGWRAVMNQLWHHGPQVVSDEAAQLLGRFTQDCLRSSKSYAFLHDAREESAAYELERAGMAKLHWVDSGEIYYFVHPFARWPGPSN